MKAGEAPEIAAKREAYTKHAIDQRVFGAPFFVVDGERFWGQDRLDFVDRKLGGWHPILELDGTFIPQVLKCDGPICPYHNGRMSMEIIERYRHHQGK